MDDSGRNNEAWMKHLRGDGSEQQKALSDLRDALLRGLRRALSKRSIVDEAFLEDTVQDSLVRILDRIGQFEGRSRFLTWATSIAIRVAMSELRRRRWKDVSLSDVLADSQFEPEQAVSDQFDTLAERKEILNEMHGIIQNELTDKQRSALLAEMKGMPQDEVARHLGSNRNAVYKLTHDARKRLKQHLELAGYEASDIHAAFTN